VAQGSDITIWAAGVAFALGLFGYVRRGNSELHKRIDTANARTAEAQAQGAEAAKDLLKCRLGIEQDFVPKDELKVFRAEMKADFKEVKDMISLLAGRRNAGS